MKRSKQEREIFQQNHEIDLYVVSCDPSLLKIIVFDTGRKKTLQPTPFFTNSTRLYPSF